MATRFEQLLQLIENGPSGPEIAALFDLDRTLIHGFSAQDVLTERMLRGEMSLGKVASTVRTAVEYGTGRIPFVEFVNRAAADLGDRPDVENYAFGRRVFEKRIAQRIFPESRALVQAHRRKGHTLAVISSATPYQVQPVADDLGIRDVLCTHLEVIDGICTGRVLEPACFGPGKAAAAEDLALARGLDLDRSFFYSDGIEDLPLLERVGQPRPLNPDQRLTQVARERKWPIVRFYSRGTPGLREIVRTGLAYGSLGTAAGFGLADLILNRSPQHARNLSATLWGELATAAIDLRLEVKGEEHLWSHRPAVFVFNHQSALDAVVMVKLLQRDFTGIAKKEVRTQPIVGQIFEAAGAIFIDRANRSKAIAAMRPAVEALKEGTSIVIAPEGTRSPTRALGPFKKGAFHLAMQGRVPMVPVVLKNTTDWMPKGALLARPGVVEVEVLPPVDTSNWTPETIDEHVAQVRQMYVDALEM